MGVSIVMAEVPNLKKRAPHVKELKAIVPCHYLAETVVTAAVLQVFRAAPVTNLELSIYKVATVSGGVLQSSVQTAARTAAVCTRAVASFSDSATMRKKGFQFVASEIDGTLSSPPKLCAGEAKDVSKGELWETSSSSPFAAAKKGETKIFRSDD